MRVTPHVGKLQDERRFPREWFRGFRLVLARPPTAAETERLVRLQADAVADFRADAARAKKLATEPLGPLPTDLAADEAELAAWTVVANVILNLDEAFMCP